MNDFGQEQQVVHEQPTRTGIQILNDEQDLIRRSTPNGLEAIKTKPVKFGSIGEGSLLLRKPLEIKDGPAYTLDEKGQIVEGGIENLFNKGLYLASLHIKAPNRDQESHDLLVNMWIENGQVLESETKQLDYPDEDVLVVPFKNERGSFMLPADPEILKEIRVSFQTHTSGGEIN